MSEAHPLIGTSAEIIGDFPVEICNLIGRYLHLDSLARLCLASHATHLIYNPALYHTVESKSDPPKCIAMFTTLASQRPAALESGLGPHPASLVQQILVTQLGAEWSMREKEVILRAFNNLWKTAAGRRKSSALRRIEWRASDLVNDIGGIVSQNGHFPSLRKLDFACMEAGNWKILSSPKLEFVQIHIGPVPLPSKNDLGPQAKKLIAGLKKLATTSPTLHTLKIDLAFYDMSAGGIVIDNSVVYALFTKALNIGPRFPALRCFRLTMPWLVPAENFHSRKADLGGFLAAHPLLSEVTLDARHIHQSEFALAAVTKFTGSTDDAVMVCEHSSVLESLKVLLCEPNFATAQNEELDGNEAGKCRRIPLIPSVKELAVEAVEDYCGPTIEKWAFTTNGPDVTHLARSFPNLTRLELILRCNIPTVQVAITSLHALEFLRLTTFVPVFNAQFTGFGSARKPVVPVHKYFPVKDSTKTIADDLVPSLPHLETVQLNLNAIFMQPHTTGVGEYWIEYQFWVKRKEGEKQTPIDPRVMCICVSTDDDEVKERLREKGSTPFSRLDLYD